MTWKAPRNRSDDTVPFTLQGRIGRVESPAPEAFRRRYVQANRPVVLQGVMEDWPALSRWTWDYLAQAGGDRAGEVIVSRNGLYPDYLTEPSPMAKVDMTMAELLRRALPPGEAPEWHGGTPAPVLAPGETYYLYGKTWLFDAVPGLRDDLRTPACLGDVAPSSQSAWISTTGCVTPLHYDMPNGLLCQVRGAKRVWLFDPAQGDLLYPRGRQFPGLDNFERQSQVDIHHPDPDTFPAFARATAFECLLRQGDTLFIPSNWWHEVETLETSISVSFNFPGGTTTSELAALSDAFKKLGGGRSGAVNGMDLFRRAGQGEPAASSAPPAGPDLGDPRVLEELMSSPAVQRLLQDPAMMDALARMMVGRTAD